MHPILFRLGELQIKSFGVMWLAAAAVGYAVFHLRMRKTGTGALETQLMYLGAIVLGLALSKSWYWAEHMEELRSSSLFDIATGPGLRWHAFLLAGIVTAAASARAFGIRMGDIFDAAAVAAAPGQAVGRLGCLLAGDGCLGGPTDLPWGVTLERSPHMSVHPTPIYEFINLFIIFFILLWVGKRSPKPWFLAFLYLFLTGLQRFVVEFWRVEPRILGSLTAYHLIALLSLAIGVAGMLKIGFPRRS